MEIRNISLDELRAMVKFYIDSKDKELIENYVHALLKLAKDFDAGVKHIRPTVTFNNKTYYGEKLEIIDEKIFIDGQEVPEKDIQYSGNISINNVKIGEKVLIIKIIGDLTSDNIHHVGNLSCDNLSAKNINVGCNLHADSVSADKIEAQEIHAGSVTANNLNGDWKNPTP